MLKGVAAALLCGSSICASGATEYKQLTNLPTVYLDTEYNQAILSKEDYYNATLRYVDENGVKLYDALGVRGRGNSTWGLPKKPYRIKFDKKQEFLGKDHAKAKSWTLLANHADKTLMRNALASYVGRLAGQEFIPAAQFVDLVLNGKYVGNYQISDQIEVRAKRVDITEQSEPATADSDITGGYLLEVDGFAESEPVYFTTPKGVKITIKSPDDEIINRNQIDYISNHIRKFETALFSSSFTDDELGYHQYVDEESLASWYVASEVVGNSDAFWSIYIYKKENDDRIYWGPMWDYDIAFNNDRRLGDQTRKIMYADGHGQKVGAIWMHQMWKDPWFVRLVYKKWQELKALDIESKILDYIDTLEEELSQSQKLNFDMWPINKRVYEEYQLFATYGQGVEFIRTFVKSHLAYLDQYFSQRYLAAVDNIASDDTDCIASYDRASQTLRFSAPDPSGMVEVYAMSGALVLRSPMLESIGLSLLPRGMYVVRYSAGGVTSSLKLVR